MEEWLIANSSLPLTEIAERLSVKFFPLTKEAVYGKIKRMGIKKVNRNYKKHLYTSEMKEFIREQYVDKNMTIREVAEAFTEKYEKTSFDTIRRVVHELGIVKKACVNYKKIPKHHPVGTISRQGDFGQKLCIKINNIRGSRKNKHKIASLNWIPYDQYVYEKETGSKLDKKMLLLHLDGNQENCKFKNLYPFPKNSMGKMIANGFLSKDAEITKTGAMIVELFYTLKEQGVV